MLHLRYFFLSRVIYQRAADFLLKQDGINCRAFGKGEQSNPYTNCPYQPIKLDARHGKPRNTPLKGGQFDDFETGKSNIMGIDTLKSELTPTGGTL